MLGGELSLGKARTNCKNGGKNIQSNDDALSVHKTIQDMHMFAKNSGQMTKFVNVIEKAKKELCQTGYDAENIKHEKGIFSKKRVLAPDDPMILGTGFVNENPNAGRHKKGWERKTKNKKNKKKRKSHSCFDCPPPPP